MSGSERHPKEPPEWDPNQSRYWDPRDLEQETLRHFQICHECRMCVGYCGSFPILFNAIDREVDSGRAEGSERTNAEDIQTVSDHCWQCKICYIKCPYTDADDAGELLDFPRLMAREKAQRARRDGVPFVDQVLGEPRLIGRLGAGPPARVANAVNSNKVLRVVTEKVTGISSKFALPPLAEQPFGVWFEKHEPTVEAGSAGDVVLFSTCYGDFNFPEVPASAVLVLEKNGYRVHWPEGQSCCGMPNLDGGDVERAKQKMAANVELLIPHVRAGRKIVVPGPTCGYTMKQEWPIYVGTEEAREVAAATLDLMQFLDLCRKEKTLNVEFVRGYGKVVYHAACHLRAQKIAFPAARVLGKLPDTEVRIVQECSAVDGTWGMKADYYEEGVRYARKLTAEARSENADQVIGDCSLSALRILKETGREMLHPIVAMAEAYGLGRDAS